MTKKKIIKKTTTAKKLNNIEMTEAIEKPEYFTNPINSSEQKLMSYIRYFFVTPYNWSLLLTTALMWWLSCYSSYNANANFDMIATVSRYIFAASLITAYVGIATSFRVEKGARYTYRHISKLGVINVILSVLTIIMSKNFLTCQIGIFILMPTSMFNLLIIAKNIWLANDEREG